MKVWLPRIVLLLVALLALFLRREGGSQAELLENSVPDAGWAMLDAQSTEHLRRIECALDGAPLGGSDHYWAHPNAVESPITPLYEAVLVSWCESGAASLDPASRERRLAGSGPWLGLWTVLAAYYAARAWTRQRWLALLVALYAAVAPALVSSSLAGHLSAQALWWPVVLAYCGTFVRSLRAEDAVSTVLSSLAAGALAGLCLALSPLSWVPFLAATLAGTWRAFQPTPGPTAGMAARAGLMHALAAALVSRLPIVEGPWLPVGESALFGWAQLSSLLALVSSTPFVVAVLVDRSRETRLGAKVAVWIAGLLMIVYLATQARTPLAELIALLPNALGFLHALERASYSQALLAATPLCLLLPIAGYALRARARDPQVLFALALGSSAVLCWSITPLALSLVALTCMVLLPIAAESARSAAWLRFGASAALMMLMSLAGLLLFAKSSWPGGEALAYLRGLRWMREGTASPGPWNAPRASPDWGVLALPQHGEAIAYHARRPALHTRWEVLRDPTRALQSSALLAGKDWEALERWMRMQGARYLCVARGDSARLEQGEFANWAGTQASKGSVLAKLERGELSPTTLLREVHQASHPADPAQIVLRIYELGLPPELPDGPTLRQR